MRISRLSARLACSFTVLLAVAQLSGCTTFRAATAYQRGSAALDRGDATRAIAELEAAAVWLPHVSEIQNHLGIAYSMAGSEAAALSAFRRAVALDCDNRAAERNLAEAEALAARSLRAAKPGDAEEPP